MLEIVLMVRINFCKAHYLLNKMSSYIYKYVRSYCRVNIRVW